MLYYLIDFTPFWNIGLQSLECLELEYSSNFTSEHKIKIFRLKKIIEEVQLTKNKQQTTISKEKAFDQQEEIINQSFVSEVLAIRLNSQINSLLDESCIQYMQFWKILQAEAPKIQTVDKELTTCSKVLKRLERLWENNKAAQSHLNIMAKRNYGLFLIHILKREKEGRELLKDYLFNAKKLAKKKHNIENLILRDSLESISDALMMVKVNTVRKGTGDLKNSEIL